MSGKTELLTTTNSEPATPRKTRDHERHQLVRLHVDADGRRPDGIVPDALQGLAEGGSDDPVHREKTERRNGQGVIVGAVRGGDPVRERDAVDAVVAAGEGIPSVDRRPDEGPRDI